MLDQSTQRGSARTRGEAVREARANASRARRLAAQQPDRELQRTLLDYADEAEERASELERD